MSPDDDIKHFLVARDVARNETTVVEFGTDYEAAQDAYQEAEQTARGRRDLDVVLLSADSLETIKLTHSSYFEPKSLDELLSPTGQIPRRANLRPLAPEASGAEGRYWAFRRLNAGDSPGCRCGGERANDAACEALGCTTSASIRRLP